MLMPEFAVRPRLALLLVPALVLASWIFLLAGAGTGMNVAAMSTLRLPPPMDMAVSARQWNPLTAVSMLVMWWVMMMAMMLPGIAIAVLRISRSKAGHLHAATLFCLGYALAWLVFSVLATAVHYGLEKSGLIHPMMMWSLNGELSAGILLAVGLYQLSAIKARSLRRCRREFPPENPLHSGMNKGRYCLVNSTPLMSLLFVGGVMNIYLIVMLSLINLLENQLHKPQMLSMPVGLMCLLAAFVIAV